ncbi:hypothetical protein DUNSADRAFT_8463 [Dunaliella salina]|uniref:Uncharacterized protein n=1 Tax=Dunaliella salina TaxID=3046 RepID=A0ABQ7FSU6_DUNSA|nr:hypothetical protein DUNSADRAFT_8463 [Dunaliella salina]|eukprot:KAF5825577.1 hypothetical protein DUNSADRAFT_8463 [Dunaliella salina]
MAHLPRPSYLAARVQEEHERLVHIFVGPDGLKPSAWPRLPHQLALVAERNVKRQDKLEQERYELEVWSLPDVLNAAIQYLQASGPLEVQQGRVSPKRRTTSSSWSGRNGALQHNDTMTSKQRRTALDVVNRIVAGKHRLKNRRSSTGISLDEMDYERVRNVAAGYKDKVKKSAAARTGSTPRRESRGAGKSPKSFKFGAPQRKSPEDKGSGTEDHASSPKDAQDKTHMRGRPRTSELFTGHRPSFGSRGLPSFDGSSRGSHRGSHAGSSRSRMAGSRARRVEDVSEHLIGACRP